MRRCERCGLSTQGHQRHAAADDCIRKQAACLARLERRLARATICVRAAEQARRATLKELTRERERTRNLDQVRTSLHSAWRQAAAESQSDRRRLNRLLARLRQLAGDPQKDPD